MYTNKMQKAEKQLSTHDMSISVQIRAGHSAKESPEMLVPRTCVNFKKMVLLVSKHVGCGYTPRCGYTPPSPTVYLAYHNYAGTATCRHGSRVKRKSISTH